MISHDAIRSVDNEDYSSKSLRERLITIAAFSAIGLALLAASWWV